MFKRKNLSHISLLQIYMQSLETETELETQADYILSL